MQLCVNLGKCKRLDGGTNVEPWTTNLNILTRPDNFIKADTDAHNWSPNNCIQVFRRGLVQVHRQGDWVGREISTKYGLVSNVLTHWLPITSLNVSGTRRCQPTHVYKHLKEAPTAEGSGSLRGNQDSLAVSVTVITVITDSDSDGWQDAIAIQHGGVSGTR